MSTTTTSFRNILGDSLRRINDNFKNNSKNQSDEAKIAKAKQLYELGRAKAAEGKHGTAIGAYHKALTIQRRCLGKDCPEAGRTLNDIGVSLMELEAEGEDFAALTAFEEALHIRQTVCGDGSEEVVETMSNMWKLLHRVRMREEREEASGSAHGEVDGTSSSGRRKSSISSSARGDRTTRRLSVTIAEAISQGRRRSTVALDINSRDQAVLAELVDAGETSKEEEISDWKV